ARRRGKVEPRYHRAPIDDGVWATLIDQDVLLVLSTGYRVCGTIIAVTDETVRYEDPDSGARTAARYMVTAVHEASWECDKDSSIPKVEWALPGAATGMAIAGAGLVFGILQDAGVFPDRPGSHIVRMIPTVVFGAPLVGIAGRSTARDLRVRGVPGARVTGWVVFGGGALATVLWSVGHLGGIESLQFTGLASIGGGLSFAGAGLLGFDALRSRKEMLAVRRRDAEPAKTSVLRGLRLGVTPLGGGFTSGVHGFGVGLSGRL
ncbi:MAG: hypothetical protein KC486_09370, partial [Myxococcales bacterium]|nr:hypothetical protein [Myxococcales bacterium]